MTFKFPGRGLKWNDAGTFVRLAVVENLEFMAMYYNGRGRLKRKVNNLGGIGPLVTYGTSNAHTKIADCGINNEKPRSDREAP